MHTVERHGILMQFTSKQMARESRNFEKKEQEELKKVADAIKKNRPVSWLE